MEHIKTVMLNKFVEELSKTQTNTKPLTDLLAVACHQLTAVQVRLTDLHSDAQRLERIPELREVDKMRAALAVSITLEVFQEINTATARLANLLEKIKPSSHPTPVGTA